MKLRSGILTFVACALLLGVSPGKLQAAEEATVEAFATWNSAGRLFRVGEKQGVFVGGLAGVMFIQGGDGALNAAKIVCPGMIDINLENGQTTGEGRCIITGLTGNRVFAKWECQGLALVGCKGKFELTAGTGKFQGVTGGGEIVLRSVISQHLKDPSADNVQSIGMGLAVWPKLTYRLP